MSLRELAESLTRWLVQEHQGKADLQQQRPSSVELTEVGQVGTFYEVQLEEPGLAGRRFCFVLRHRPLADYPANFPQSQDDFDAQALISMTWPQGLEAEPGQVAIVVWDQACLLGQRNPALDLLQHWLREESGGTFATKDVMPKGARKKGRQIPLFGREEEMALAKSLLLTPTARENQDTFLISLAAPGGTGKSFFLKALKAQVGHRVAWAGVDHQGIEKETSSVGLLGRLLAQLAQSLEEQSIRMDSFTKELRSFRKRLDVEGASSGGFFGHLRKAAETAAGINPILGALSAGVVFLTSWGQEAKEESEALAKDNAIKALTDAFKKDLGKAVRANRSEAICWIRPVLVFDTYEWLAPLVDTWMRTEFFADDFLQNTGVLVVLSGREHLLRIDTRWSEWQHATKNITLGSFDRATAGAYLESLQVAPERRDTLYEWTDGLPLFLSLATNFTDQDQSVAILATRVLEEISAEHHADFLKASVLDSFERPLLEALFEDKSEAELDATAQLLGRATFTIASDSKRAFLGPVRKILRRALVLEVGDKRVEELESLVRGV